MAEKEKKDQNTVVIEKYLQNRALQDNEFAAKLQDPSKSISKCMEYIRNQAKKMAVNGCAMVEDEVVYGWAVHYFDEKTQETPIRDAKAAEMCNSSTKEKKCSETKEKGRHFVQLSMFD